MLVARTAAVDDGSGMSTMTATALRAPFSYFGCKTAVASEVWARLGNPRVYIEPFVGSAAVLLARPGGAPPPADLEIVNDADGHLSNLWRAIQTHPSELVEAMVTGAREVDMHATAAVAVERTADLVARLEGDPAFCDPQLASWWLVGARASIPGDWLKPGPWHRERCADGTWRLVKGEPGSGVTRSVPGSHGSFGGPNLEPERWLGLLAERLRRVQIFCGDWARALSPSTLNPHNRPGVRAVFLDPPYLTAHESTLYRVDEPGVAEQVREWCLAADPTWRIALAGYDDEHAELQEHGWSVLRWRARGGFGNDRTSERERLWFSPGCLDPVRQPTLF